MSQYATVEELKVLAIPGPAIDEVSDADLDAQLQASAGMMDAYLAVRYSMPLVEGTGYPDALKRCNVDMATFHVMLRHGFDPQAYDANYKEMHDRCIDFLEMVRDGKLTIPGIEDQTPAVNESAPRVYTSEARGW